MYDNLHHLPRASRIAGKKEANNKHPILYGVKPKIEDGPCAQYRRTKYTDRQPTLYDCSTVAYQPKIYIRKCSMFPIPLEALVRKNAYITQILELFLNDFPLLVKTFQIRVV